MLLGTKKHQIHYRIPSYAKLYIVCIHSIVCSKLIGSENMCDKCKEMTEEVIRLTKELEYENIRYEDVNEQYKKLKNAIDKIANIVTDVW